MDRHIKEDTARNLDVAYRRCTRITGANLEDIEITDLSALNSLSCRLEIVVKTAVEAYLILNVAVLKSLLDLKDLIYIVVDRLFAEDVLSCGDSLK